MITLCTSNSIDLNVNSCKVYPANISISDQLYSNVDPTLKIKQNPTSVIQRCTTLIQRRMQTLKQRWNDVEATLCNIDTNVVETTSKPIGPLNMDL